MSFYTNPWGKRIEEKASLVIFNSVIKDFYTDWTAIVTSLSSVMIAASILYSRTSNPTHILFALAIGLAGAKWLWDYRGFKRQWPCIRSDLVQLTFWEKKYMIWAFLYVTLPGFWYFCMLANSSDNFVLLTIISIMLINLLGITVRNFRSVKVVNAQLAGVSTPLVSGSILFMNPYHTMPSMLLIPFFICMKLMADNLRKIFHKSAMTAYKNNLMAMRFDTAFNNISHGIAMIDEARKFVVVNENFADLAGVKSQALIGRTISDVEGGKIFMNDSNCTEKNIFADMEQCLQNNKARQYSFTLKDRRVIEYHYYPMKDGGIVLLENVSARMASEMKINALAKIDPLTRLPNRRFLMEETRRLLVKNDQLTPCAWFFVDLDRFKEINDSLGHTAGDRLLSIIAMRLKSVADKEAVICRFGGDEFVIVIPGLSDRKKCGKFAKNLIRKVSDSVFLDGYQLTIGATVGIAICPEDATDPNLLLKFADSALYKAKSIERGTFAFYSKTLGKSIKNRRQIGFDLRKAIDCRQLRVHYQPLINIPENRVYTCEALLRWSHPDRGWVEPEKFIPVAEDTGFIIRLGEYVLQEAIVQCAKWPTHVNVAVNVSFVQFERSNIIETIDKILKKTGLAPHRLEIEVTESTMPKNIDDTAEVLVKLSSLGVKISLDDFGTGFSSLNYLHSLPLDKIKIDRSFVENIHIDKKSRLLFEGISRLSHSLGLEVVVEGVETVGQLDLLQKNPHVDEVQGFLFGKALPAEDLTRLLYGEEPLSAIKESFNGDKNKFITV